MSIQMILSRRRAVANVWWGLWRARPRTWLHEWVLRWLEHQGVLKPAVGLGEEYAEIFIDKGSLTQKVAQLVQEVRYGYRVNDLVLYVDSETLGIMQREGVPEFRTPMGLRICGARVVVVPWVKGYVVVPDPQRQSFEEL